MCKQVLITSDDNVCWYSHRGKDDRILNFLQRNQKQAAIRVRTVSPSTSQTRAALSFNRQSREETLMMCKHPSKRGERLSGEAPRGRERKDPDEQLALSCGLPQQEPWIQTFVGPPLFCSPVETWNRPVTPPPQPPTHYTCSCWKFPWKWPVEASSLPSPHTAAESRGLAEVTPPEGNVSPKQMGLNIAQYPQSELH